MSRRTHVPKIFAAVLIMAVAFVPALYSQHTTALQPDATTPHRTRLILKDGSYQIIMSYKIVGNVVRYISAERGGAEEEIPLSLVDLDATKRWERQHAQPSDDPNNPQPPAIDPELLKRRRTALPLPRKLPKIYAFPKRTALSLSTPTAARRSSSLSLKLIATSTAIPATTS